MSKKWGVFPQDNGDIVVLPLKDKKEHVKLSSACPCMPEVQICGAKVLIVHNAFDFRHVKEWFDAGQPEIA